MIDQLSKVWHSRLFLVLCAFWMVGVLVALFAPKIDAYFRPAVSEFIVDRGTSYRREDAVYLSGTMIKNRCKFLAVNVLGFSNDADPIQLPLLFQDSKIDQTADRPRGKNEWGPWRIGVLAQPNVWGISIHASHQCGTGFLSWTINTELGPVIVLDSIKEAP